MLHWMRSLIYSKFIASHRVPHGAGIGGAWIMDRGSLIRFDKCLEIGMQDIKPCLSDHLS